MEEIHKFIRENNIEITIKSNDKELISMGCINGLDMLGIRNSMTDISTLENNTKILEYIKNIILLNYVNKPI